MFKFSYGEYGHQEAPRQQTGEQEFLAALTAEGTAGLRQVQCVVWQWKVARLQIRTGRQLWNHLRCNPNGLQTRTFSWYTVFHGYVVFTQLRIPYTGECSTTGVQLRLVAEADTKREKRLLLVRASPSSQNIYDRIRCALWLPQGHENRMIMAYNVANCGLPRPLRLD